MFLRNEFISGILACYYAIIELALVSFSDFLSYKHKAMGVQYI